MIQIINSNFAFTPTPQKWMTLENHFLVLEDGVIRDIYPVLPEKYCGIDVERYEDHFFIPAFNDIHVHAPQYGGCGIGFDDELLSWLENHVFPLEARFSDIEVAKQIYRQFVHDLWQVGTMRSCVFATIHTPATALLFDLFEASGLKAFVGKVNMDRNSPPSLIEDTRTSLRETEQLIQATAEKYDHVKFIVTPRFVPSTTPTLMEGLGKLVQTYELPVQSHLCENRDEVKWVRELHPELASFTDVYREYGLLPEGKTIMAHAIHLTDAERRLLKERQVLLAHCPISNDNLSSGIMPARRNLDFGLHIGMGSDVGGGHRLNMIFQIVDAMQVSKLHWVSHSTEAHITLSEAFHMATKENGRFFGKVGSFEPGFAFDALMIQPKNNFPAIPNTLYEQVEKFIYCGDDRQIERRYCDGKIIEAPFA